MQDSNERLKSIETDAPVFGLGIQECNQVMVVASAEFVLGETIELVRISIIS